MIILRYDSRDKLHYQKFGQAVQFPDEINFDTANYDDIQPSGNVMCTCYTTCDIAEDQQNLTFDIEDLWKRIPSNQFGADPREVLGEAVKNGLLVVGETNRRKSWASYWRADFGMHDKFDNLRSAMIQAKSPVGVATYWYSNWPSGETLPIGVGPTNGHMYSVEGWKQINGKPHLIIDAWIGRKLYMSREVFNEAMKPYGMQSWVLSTSEIDARMEKTLTETVKDLLINIIIKLRELLTLKVDNSVEKTVDNSYNEVKEAIMTKYKWDNQKDARHSTRVICDEEGLSVKDKNDLCATVGGESGWKPGAIGKENPDVFKSRDYGIIQLNDHYWIGEGKAFPSTDYVLTHPEEMIRWMCKQWKAGNKHWWYAFKNGSYKKYLNPKFDNSGKLIV